ncbi:MAG: hypothetical protein HYR92_04470 [Burkholderiales bacterium]|nr:hypothetical protein [Burkholderiales bacterium]
MRQISKIQQMLNEIQFESDEADREAMYSVVDELHKLEHPRKFLPQIFQWLEENSKYDLGSPGPFGHFIEEESDYLDFLFESLQRKPTDITVWLANRIANSKNDQSEIASWIEHLKATSVHSLADESTIESALDFVAHQSARLALIGQSTENRP